MAAQSLGRDVYRPCAMLLSRPISSPQDHHAANPLWQHEQLPRTALVSFQNQEDLLAGTELCSNHGTPREEHSRRSSRAALDEKIHRQQHLGFPAGGSTPAEPTFREPSKPQLR